LGVPVLVLLRSGDWGSRHQAVILAVTAAAMGDRVLVALSGPALRAWVEGRFDEGAPPEAAEARVGSLAGMLAEGRQGLGVRVVACATELQVAGLDPDRARAALDGLRSLPEQWSHASGGRVVAF
jgi:peroxiredoxin family protein